MSVCSIGKRLFTLHLYMVLCLLLLILYCTDPIDIIPKIPSPILKFCNFQFDLQGFVHHCVEISGNCLAQFYRKKHYYYIYFTYVHCIC